MPTLQTYGLGKCYADGGALSDIKAALEEILEASASATGKIPVLATGFAISPNISSSPSSINDYSNFTIWNSVANVNMQYRMYNLGVYYSSSGGYNNNYTYYIDYIKDSNIIAFGIRGDIYAKKVNLPIIFAKNANGSWKCILPSIDSKYGYNAYDYNNNYSSSKSAKLTSYTSYAGAVSSSYAPVTSFAHPTYSNPIKQLGIQDSAVKNVFTMCHNNNDGVGVSLVQMPDIYEGCLFNNLYLVLSGSITSGSVVNVGGEDYQILAAPNVIVGGNALACKL